MKKGKQKNFPKKVFPISKGSHSVITLSSDETYRLGKTLGQHMTQGVVALFGDLGAGKTVFAKGMAEALGVKNVVREVVSPTFMLVREHEGNVPFYHMDLYRLESEEEFEQINLKEYFNRQGVTLVEWAQRALSVLPTNHIEVYFEILGKKKRRIEFRRNFHFAKMIKVLK
ncbi:MAG: tRNA (adenosine(37)-N6)-threonylcarbamoyltransferase complex ATPase subunit type 1 TsaE [Chlamydiae bacterium]|nr:tRNA (adenosine(37)-N6)-threonylcarbamoyltransferase complex ATPase subunit type 1 TsaE [Chlamydiota bacterium]MBI3277042.1 tRNA (adenosine(37)-N6)-threonylcarbamoyltransferase complex ATPase subunit type 1 TsaE [Chlamydiota bacterium]